VADGDVVKTAAQITAQVAVEAIANAPSGYDRVTVEAVRRTGIEQGVSALYMDMLPTYE
jgi:hypothetical protein